MLPGPKIQVCKNDMIVMNVENRINIFESITIHAHGLKQKDYQYMVNFLIKNIKESFKLIYN